MAPVPSTKSVTPIAISAQDFLNTCPMREGGRRCTNKRACQRVNHTNPDDPENATDLRRQLLNSYKELSTENLDYYVKILMELCLCKKHALIIDQVVDCAVTSLQRKGGNFGIGAAIARQRAAQPVAQQAYVEDCEYQPVSALTSGAARMASIPPTPAQAPRAQHLATPPYSPSGSIAAASNHALRASRAVSPIQEALPRHQEKIPNVFQRSSQPATRLFAINSPALTGSFSTPRASRSTTRTPSTYAAHSRQGTPSPPLRQAPRFTPGQYSNHRAIAEPTVKRREFDQMVDNLEAMSLRVERLLGALASERAAKEEVEACNEELKDWVARLQGENDVLRSRVY